MVGQELSLVPRDHINKTKQSMVVHACNPDAGGAETSGFLGLVG